MRRRIVIGSLCLVLGLGVLRRSDIVQAGNYFSPSNTRGKDFSVIEKDGLWHLFIIQEPIVSPPNDQPEYAGLGHATSVDLQHWTEQGVSLPVGAPGSWDERSVWAPTVLKQGDLYYMFYTGVKHVGTHFVQGIGVATSPDLVTWSKVGAGPVFDCSQSSWQYWNLNDVWGAGTDCRDPYVIRDTANNRWVMLYQGRFNGHIDGPAISVDNPGVVGMAFSDDLLTWTDQGYLSATAGYKNESPHVFTHNGTWYLVFTGNCNYRSTKCLVVSTAPALTGPYSDYSDLPAVPAGAFASEYFTDSQGREYFAFSDNGTIRFRYLDWSSGSFDLQQMVEATVIGGVFLDENRNGVEDIGENGIDGVQLRMYLDNGNNLFDRIGDVYLAPATSTYIGRGGPDRVHGTYRRNYVPEGRIWFEVISQNQESGGSLDGLEATTPLAQSLLLSANGTYSGPSFGFVQPDTTPPNQVSNLSAL